MYTGMVRRNILFLFLLVLAILFGGIDYYLIVNKQDFSRSSKISQVSPSPWPEVVISIAKASQIMSVDSPDGKLTLIMKRTNKDNGVLYSFTVSGKTIFEKTVESSISFSMPPNAWSPDNKYVFLKETGVASSNFFVLSATKDASEQNDQTANITQLFLTKYPDLTIKDVTGWGGMNLVVVNSNKSDGVRGSSFWFEAPSHSLIQLSTRF